MAFVCKAGATALISDSTSHIPHLHICLINPTDNPLKTILINVTTLRSYSDTSIILDVGDHPFITHESVLSYRDCAEVEISRLLILESQGDLVPNVDLDPTILSIIQNVVMNSGAVRMGVKLLLNEIKTKNPALLIP